MLEEMLVVVLFAVCGALMRVIYGIYKAYASYLDIKVSKKRLAIEFVMSVWFGFVGGAFLTESKVITLGINLGTFVSSVLGANVVDLIVKKFGFSKKMEVIVSDQQLRFPEFNSREINAIGFVKKEGKITNKIYERINSASRDVARHELGSLANKKMLKRVGKNKGTYYVSF
jgi:uncharacterized membrane protein YsdA (DUF1294 family)